MAYGWRAIGGPLLIKLCASSVSSSLTLDNNGFFQLVETTNLESFIVHIKGGHGLEFTNHEIFQFH